MWVLVLGMIAGLAPAVAGAADVEAEVHRLIEASGAEVAVAFETLDGRDRLFLRADEPFHAASTMKVPVMIELFRQADIGRLRLDDRVVVRNRFRSIVDGSPYTLSPADDSDPEVYRAVGRSLPYRRLCEAMITVSSNLATNILIEDVGVEAIQTTVHLMQADGMVVRRGVEDNKAYRAGLSNTTTARALLTLLTAIAAERAVSPEASRAMRAILERQQFKDAIPAGLPPGTRVAHKTGNITAIHHDAAIVDGPRPYVLVLLVRGLKDQRESGRVMAAITRAIDQHVTPR